MIQFCCWVFLSRFAVNKPFVNLVPATVMVFALQYSWEYIVPRCELLDKIANHKDGPKISICSSFYIYSSNASYCFSIKITFTLTCLILLLLSYKPIQVNYCNVYLIKKSLECYSTKRQITATKDVRLICDL